MRKKEINKLKKLAQDEIDIKYEIDRNIHYLEFLCRKINIHNKRFNKWWDKNLSDKHTLKIEMTDGEIKVISKPITENITICSILKNKKKHLSAEKESKPIPTYNPIINGYYWVKKAKVKDWEIMKFHNDYFYQFEQTIGIP
jgi:hypothetical protein